MGTNEMISGLGTALFTKTQRQVLGLLFGHPERSYYAKELVRLAGVGSGTVLRELDKLARVGLLTVERIGNQKHYRANRISPIFAELRSIVAKTFGVADLLRGALESCRGEVVTAFVYGSVAAGTDQAGSDIDLMIVSDSLAYPELLALLADVEARLGRKVNPTLYGIVEFAEKAADGSGFVARVLSQPKIALIGSCDDLAEPR